MFVRCFWLNVSQSPSFFSSFLRLVCSLKIGLTFLQLLQHRHQMNPYHLFTFYWYQCALCVSWSLVPVDWYQRPATVYWYQKPVSVTSALDYGLFLGWGKSLCRQNTANIRQTALAVTTNALSLTDAGGL